jgi:hypothetical protein
VPLHSNVLKDQDIRFTGSQTSLKYPEQLRRIVVWDQENEKEVELLTNHLNLELPPSVKSIAIAGKSNSFLRC